MCIICVSQARGEVPRLPNGLPEKSSRLDRPRARDRPKPRRRPRPKEPGETTRRSRSAPAQSSPAVPQPPTHTAHHEGFLFRKLDIESLKKSTNRWVFRAIMKILAHRVDYRTLVKYQAYILLTTQATFAAALMSSLPPPLILQCCHGLDFSMLS